MSRPYLCGFCATSEASEFREKQSQDPQQSPITDELSSLFNTDYNEQYGRRYICGEQKSRRGSLPKS